MVRFTGTVIRATLPRVIQSKEEFVCRKCHLKFTAEMDPVMKNSIPKPSRCPNIEGERPIIVRGKYPFRGDFYDQGFAKTAKMAIFKTNFSSVLFNQHN